MRKKHWRQLLNSLPTFLHNDSGIGNDSPNGHELHGRYYGQGRGERRDRGLGMTPCPLLTPSVDSRGGRRSASGHEWLMLLNAGTLAVGLRGADLSMQSCVNPASSSRNLLWTVLHFRVGRSVGRSVSLLMHRRF